MGKKQAKAGISVTGRKNAGVKKNDSGKVCHKRKKGIFIARAVVDIGERTLLKKKNERGRKNSKRMINIPCCFDPKEGAGQARDGARKARRNSSLPS